MFLFVDYDQGLGGEYFCANLSRASQCNTLETHTYSNSRTKVKDVFGQEYLKPTPALKILDSPENLYDVVPVHRQINLIQDNFKNFKSMRLAYPTDPMQKKFVFHQRLQKVLLSPEPSTEYFLGLVKILLEQSTDLSWVKKVKPSMDSLTIHMISQGFALTEENRQLFINGYFSEVSAATEPTFPYDVVIDFSDLLYNHEKIQDQLQAAFGISSDTNWMITYQTEYNAYIKQN
jgi:hypothetical protein